MSKYGLALGGGGARGFCHIAFLKVLDDLCIRPSVIAGSSIGAIIGAFYASGMSGAEMEEMLDGIGLKEIAKMVDFKLLSDSALIKGKGIMEFINENLPAKTFEMLKTPLKIIATDFWRREQVIFSSGNVVQAIRASISLPAVFEPVKYGECVLIDGGAVNPVPYDVIQKECDTVIAIDVGGNREPKKGHPLPNMFESILSTFEIMQASIVDNKNRVLKPHIYIKPELTNVNILDVHRFRHIMDSVEEDAQELKRILAGESVQRSRKKPKKSRIWFRNWSE